MSYVAATYKIRQDQSDKIKKISEITKISQAEIVRQALDDFLARNEDIILAQKPIFARVADERQD
jgi:predicted transcriptional regulator